jgi:hypothetical protein
MLIYTRGVLNFSLLILQGRDLRIECLAWDAELCCRA